MGGGHAYARRERGCGPAAGVQGCTDKRAPVDLAHLDWGPGGWTFCDAARERAIAEGIVAVVAELVLMVMAW